MTTRTNPGGSVITAIAEAGVAIAAIVVGFKVIGAIKGSPSAPSVTNNTPLIGGFAPSISDGQPLATPPGMFQTTPVDTVRGAMCAASGGTYDALSGQCFGNDNGQIGFTTGGDF